MIQLHSNVFQLCFLLVQLLIFFVHLVAHASVLFYQKFILKLVVLCSSQPDPGLIEIFLQRVAVIFHSLSLPLVEV